MERVVNFVVAGPGWSYPESYNSDEGELPLKMDAVSEREKLIRPEKVKYFEHRHLRYLYDERAGKYVLLRYVTGITAL